MRLYKEKSFGRLLMGSICDTRKAIATVNKSLLFTLLRMQCCQVCECAVRKILNPKPYITACATICKSYYAFKRTYEIKKFMVFFENQWIAS